MSSDRIPFHSHLPAPCIVDSGTVVNKQDMRRLLRDLGPVRYRYTQGDYPISEGEGYVVEVFSDPNEATLVTNHSLYLNICSFDYLELSQVPALEDVPALDNCAQTLDNIEQPIPSLPLSQTTPHPISSKQIPKQSKNQISHETCSRGQSAETAPQDSSPTTEACFRLVQEHTVLQLIPLSNPLKSRRSRSTAVTLDAVVADMLSTNLEINEDDDCFPF